MLLHPGEQDTAVFKIMMFPKPQLCPDLCGVTLQQRFEVIRLLKSAANIFSYLGRDLRQKGSAVVIKGALVDDVGTNALLRLEHEAAVLGSLKAGGLTPILELGREQGLFYLVSPYIPGISLADRLGQGPLTVDEALRLGLDVARALGEAHACGVLHRDIKPSNIIVNGEGPLTQASLIDFGLAKHMMAKLPLGDALAFTALYAAPEQSGLLHCGVDERSDLYALGVVLYEALAGKPPFQGKQLNAILAMHLSAVPPALTQVPPLFESLLLRLLAKDPRDRYQSAASLVHDLEAIQNARQHGELTSSFSLGKLDRRSGLTEPSFVGRQQELAQLKEWVTRAKAGRSSLLMLSAPSGAGKSRLLGELARQMQAAGYLVVLGQGLDHIVHPYQILAGIASDLTQACRYEEALATRLRQNLAHHAQALCAVMPALQAVLLPAAGGPQAPEAFGEKRMAKAFTAFLSTLGKAERPVLLLFDDAQWMDKATASLIQAWQNEATGHDRTTHASLLLAVRSDEALHDQRLADLRFDQRLYLSPHTDQEMAKLLSSMAGPLPSPVLRKLIKLSGHNPFMATALLRGMVETGTLQPSPEGWVAHGELGEEGLQSSRRAAVILSQRLASFPPGALHILSVAALLGKTFELTAVISLTRAAAPEVMATLVLARNRHIIWENKQNGLYSFVHDRLRESLLSRLPEQESRALHLKAAEYRAAQVGSWDFELAYHYDAAGEGRLAYPHALRAAEHARKVSAPAVAEQYYRMAERAFVPTPNDTSPPTQPPDDDEQAVVALGLGEVLMLQGQHHASRAQLERARSRAHDKILRVRIQIALGELGTKAGKLEEGVAAFYAGLQLLGRHVPRHRISFGLQLAGEAMRQIFHSLRLHLWPSYKSSRQAPPEAVLAMQLYSHLWFAYWFLHGPAIFIWAHLRNLNLAERYGESCHLAQAYCDHSVIATALPSYKRAERYIQRSLAIREHLQEQWGLGQAISFYAATYYVSSRFKEAIAKAHEALPILERTGDRWLTNLCRWGLVHCHYRLGDLRTASDISRQVYEESVEVGNYITSSIVLSSWAMASYGRVPQELLERERARKLPSTQAKAALQHAFGLQHYYAGDYQAAVVSLRQAYAVICKAKLRNEYVTPIVLWLMSGLRAAAEALDPLDPQVDALMAEAQALSRVGLRQARAFRNNLPHAWREMAFLAAWQKKAGRAKAFIEQSLALAETQEAQHEYALSLKARARLARFFAWPGGEQDQRAAEELLAQLCPPSPPSEASTGASPATQARDLSVLARFEEVLEGGHQVVTALSEGAIFANLLQAATQLFRSERSLIVRVSSDHRAPWQVIAGNPNQPFSQTLVRDALAQGGAYTVDEAQWVSASDSLLLTGARSALCVPIYKQGEPVACLYVSHPFVSQLFQNTDVKLGRFLAVLAGSALENADGFSRLQVLNHSLSGLAEQLQEAKLEADNANRAKSQFLSNMSHEMRTPLVAILGYSRFLATPDLSPEEVQHFLDTIDRNGRVLTQLIDDVLDLTKAEAGQLKLVVSRFNLQEVLDRVMQAFSKQAYEKNLSMTLHTPGPSPVVMVSDPVRLQQLLMHVVGNAIKFTETGGVSLMVSSQTSPAGAPEITFAVQDTGCGIGAEVQKKLFQSFMQEDASHTRRFGGCGMGLYLASQLAKLLGGRMTLVKSSPAEGSLFTITVPVHLGKAQV